MATNTSRWLYFTRDNIGEYRERLEAVGIKGEEQRVAVMNYIAECVRIAIEIVRKRQGMLDSASPL